MFYAHAAMTVGANGLAKHVFVRCVVLIDEVLIWKVEAHAAKRIALARWLIYSIEPSLLRPILSPIRSSAVGSRASAGRYSFRIMEGGTFHVGLNVMYFKVSASKGVACFPG